MPTKSCSLKNKDILSTVQFHLILNIIFVLTITLASYIHIPLPSLKDKILYSIHLFTIQTSFAGLLYILSLNRVLFKIVFPIVYVVLGIVAYFVYTMDISVSESLIEACLETGNGLISELITLPLIIYLLVLIVLIIYILKLYNGLKKRNHFVITIISIIVISIIFIAEKLKPETYRNKLPYSFFSSIYYYAKSEPLQLENINHLNFKSNLKQDLQVTFVLGETVRADHLGINGYHRNTTPNLSKLTRNFKSYKNMYTNSTYTSASLRQIFTNRSIYDTLNVASRNIYDILNKANITTNWIGNQILEPSFVNLVESNDSIIIIDKLKSYDSYHKLKDNALLPYLYNDLNKDNGPKITTLHMIGSHWWYENRYDEAQRKYLPTSDSKYMPSMTQAQIVNSYDNTILYLDDFLNTVIVAHKKLKKPSIVIYIADHGESLGENGKWLHAHKSDYVSNPAFMIWYSDQFKAELYQDYESIFSELESSNLTTDIIYRLLKKLFKVEQIN